MMMICDDDACIQQFGEGNYDTDNDGDDIPNNVDACPNSSDGHDWDEDGICDSSDPCVGEGSSEEDCVSIDEPVADKIILSQNYPNPFNPSTNIEFVLNESNFINLSVYDINGRLIKTLAKGYYNEGTYNVLWNANNNKGIKVSSGIYIYQLQSLDYLLTRKMVYIK